jgi:hypothetical protein
MMVLASVVATSFAILLLFSLPSCLRLRTTPFLVDGVRAGVSPIFVRHQPRHWPTQWLLHVHENVSQHVCTIIFAVVGCLIHLPSLRPVLPLQPATPAHGRSREPTDARRCGTGRVSLAPGLSPCVPPRRTRWCLPRLGYIGDEESRSEILDNQGT